MHTRRVSGAIALAGVLALAACSRTATTNPPTSGSSTRSAASGSPAKSAANDRGVPVVVRFAHEMNGSWYPWVLRPVLPR